MTVQATNNVVSAQSVCAASPCIQPQSQPFSQDSRINQIVIVNDQSVLKGLLWGYGTFQVGSLALTSFGLTACGCLLTTLGALDANHRRISSNEQDLLMWTSILTGVGIVATSALAKVTQTCFNNTCYHLGANQVKVIQIS